MKLPCENHVTWSCESHVTAYLLQKVPGFGQSIVELHCCLRIEDSLLVGVLMRHLHTVPTLGR
jgi:hypothetical protein